MEDFLSQRPSATLCGYRSTVAAITVLLLAVGSPRVSAEILVCSNPLLSVDTSEPGLAAHTCTLATAAAERLAACHLPQRAAVRLHIVDRIIHSGISILGIYRRGDRVLEVTSPAHLATLPGPDHLYSRILILKFLIGSLLLALCFWSRAPPVMTSSPVKIKPKVIC
ncbi:MAG: hypothetical protein ACJAWL_001287 [Motiliproteus sp.]|jgi:hypothetical protein